MKVSYQGLEFERLGHASVRIEGADGTIIYLDPWSEAIDGSPGDANIVFVTHDDYDHYDPDAIDSVSGADTTVAAYEDVDTGELDLDVVGLPLRGEATVGDVDVQTFPAYNDPAGEHVDEAGEPFHAPGEVIGLLLTIDAKRILYPSDTDFLEHHESLDTDVFVPPIGGNYTMDRHEAAEFARSVDPDLVLPIHYDTWEPIEADAGAFAEELEAEGMRVELF